MGAKESKISFLSYEDAVKRVTTSEFDRIREAYKRFAGNGNFLPKLSFFNEILGELVPARLAEQLYMTCGGTNKGITFRDVLVVLVLITKGTIDEKVKFLFCLMSVDGIAITHEDLENFYNACDGGQVLPRCVNDAFWRHDKLSYDDFYQWVVQNPHFSAVTHWLLEEQQNKHAIKLSCDDDTPSFYNSLANITKLTEPDIIELEKRYWAMKSMSKTGRYDRETFQQHVCPPLPNAFCSSFFKFFDKNEDGHIDFKEMVTGISLCCRGLTSERLIACFEMFDVDRDRCLSEEELKNMLHGLVGIYKQYGETDLDEKSVEDILSELPATAGRGLELQEFRSWASTSKLIHEFLLLLSQICHIVFGLKPELREEEGCIVRRWLDREHERGLEPGLLYYLITTAWWNSWKTYVNYENDVVSPTTSSHKSVSTTFSELQPESSSSVTLNSNKPSVSCNSDVSSLSDLSVEANSDYVSARGSSGNSYKRNQVNVLNGTVLKQNEPKPPGPIDNTVLLGPPDVRKLIVLTGEGGKLKQNVVLMFGRDYDVLPEPIWKALFTWYGGTVALPRTVIVNSDNVKPQVELYPIQLLLYRHTTPPKTNGFSLNSLGINNLMTQVFRNNNTTSSATGEPPHLITPKRTLQYRASFSRKNTVKQILDFISSRLKVHVDDLRLWKMESESELVLFEDEQRTVEEMDLKESDNLLIEIRNRDLSWPEEMNSLVATKNFRERSNTGLLEKGATGLHNLGNTCFMNSAVQCLSNTGPLRKYFASNIFLYELNKANPLGMKGILAKRYGDLMCDLWSGIYRSIAPVKLRWTIGRYAPRFNGFQQHDSQELLSFLLDGLHEDVNRVHDKPYVELKDSDGRPDSEVANEAWENHLIRNQSIIVDLFQGQLKSQVRCLHCGHISVRFDPFTFLSLPLPMESSLYVEIPLFLLSGETPRKYGMLLPQDSTVKNLRKCLSSLSGLPANRLLIAEVVGAHIRSLLDNERKLRSNLIGYMCAYEINENIDLAPKIPFKSPAKLVSTNNPIMTSDACHVNNPSNTNVSNSDSLDSVTKGCTNNNTNTRKRKTERQFMKKPFKTNTDKLSTPKYTLSPVETTVSEATTTARNHLEIPGVATNISPAHSRLSSASSIEAICDAVHEGLAIAVNRKMILSTNYFLSWQKFRPTLFGIPMVLSCQSDTTNRNIYELIWKHVAKYITGDKFHLEDDRTYPYTVKAVDREGNYCVWCPWYRFCRGCSIACDDDCFSYASSFLAIDWDPTVLHLHYQQSLEKSYVEDKSISESLKMLREPICLDKCLKDFTKEEELGEEETWFCSKCQEHRTIAKKFDIWKLPPILVIHLKRFQLVNNRWIKSNKLVKFKMRGFDPSTYLVKTQRDIIQEQCHVQRKHSVGSSSTPSDVLLLTDIDEPVASTQLDGEMIDDVSKGIDVNHQDDSNNENENFYDLYAISCHSGMLNGGHYITYAKNENKKWYCYNDSSCKEVDETVVEKETPYMLFFEKRGLHAIDYMPNIKDKQPFNVQQEEDEFDKEVKKYCSLM